MKHDFGKLEECSLSKCNWKCCEFHDGNYIVLYPNELDIAIKNGYSINHLMIINEFYFGGKQAICNASSPQYCDEGYKPLDCKSYPYFPIANNGLINGLLKGIKCPINEGKIIKHASWVFQTWRNLSIMQPTILEWLREVSLVGYANSDLNLDCLKLK